MKNQNDLIVAGVAFVLAVIVVCVAIFTKREPANPGSPTAIDASMPTLPPNDVVLADALPGSQNSGTGGGGLGMMGGSMGGPMGGRMGTPMGGPQVGPEAPNPNKRMPGAAGVSK